MSRINLEDSEIRRPKIFGMTTVDIASYPAATTTATLSSDTPGIIRNSATAGSTFRMPPTLDANGKRMNEGASLTIVNAGGGSMSLVDSAGAAIGGGLSVATGVTSRYVVIGGVWTKIT